MIIPRLAWIALLAGVALVSCTNDPGGGNNDNEPDPTPPAAFALLTPADDATAGQVFAFDWEDSDGADSYRLQLDDSAAFDSPVFDVSGLTDSDLPVADVPFALLADSEYFWRVIATNADGDTTCDATFSLDTGEPGARIALDDAGDLNGVTIDSANTVLQVLPGATISGTVNIDVSNNYGASPVVPLVWTPTWGDHGTAYVEIASDVADGATSHAVTVDLTAPTTGGVYYLVFGAAAEAGAGFVASGTADAAGTPVWDDGNDLSDQTAATMTEAHDPAGGYLRYEQWTGGAFQAAVCGCTFVQIEVLDPAGHWPLDELAGTDVADATGNGHDGVLTSATLGVAGVVNTAYAFASGYVQIGPAGDDGVLDYGVDQSFTWLIWARRDWLPSGEEMLMSRRSFDAPGVEVAMHMALQTDGTIAMKLGANEIPGSTAFSTSTITDGEWHLIGITRDVDAGKCHLFIDGVSEASFDDDGWDFSGASSFRLAEEGETLGGSRQYQGDLDEARVFDVAIGADAMATIHEVERPLVDHELAWVFTAGGVPTWDSVGDLVPLEDGGCIVAGGFGASITVGSGENEVTLTHQGGETDILLLRLDADGNIDWAVSAGGSGDESARCIVQLPDGDVVIGGSFESMCTFGSGETNETTLTAATGSDAFLARFDSDTGQLVAATRVATGPDDVSISRMALAADGDVVVGGFYKTGTYTFGEGNPEETTLMTSASAALFVARYTGDAVIEWASTGSSTGRSETYDVAVCEDGTILATAQFEGDITLGSGEPGETTLTHVAGIDLLVARFDADGTLDSAFAVTGSDDQTANTIAELPDSGFVIAGDFKSNTVFGSGEPNETTLVLSADIDSFVASYNADGTLRWALAIGSTLRDSYCSARPLANGTLAVVGAWTGTVVFGSGESNETTLVSASTTFDTQDVYFALYNADGSLIHAAAAITSDGYDNRSFPRPTGDGAVFFGGIFADGAVAGSGDPGETTLDSAGGSDLFVLRYDPVPAGD